MKNFTFRKFVNDIHLWLGIGSGIILFIICLTGTIYVFSKDIIEWVDKDKVTVKVPENAQPISVTELVALLEKEKKDSKVTGIQIPEGSERAWLFTLTPKDILEKRGKEEREAKERGNKGEKGEKRGRDGERGEKHEKRERGEGNARGERKERNEAGGRVERGDKAEAGTALAARDSKDKVSKPNEKGGARGGDRERIKTYFVNPYTGEVLGDTRTASSKFFTTVMGLHRWLLLDRDIGRPITGIATLIFLLMEITGLILWLPAKLKSWKKWSAWKAGFTIKTDARWKRINHDLHNALGFYTFLLVTLMALTGLCFSFEWFRDGAGVVLGAKPFDERKAPKVQSEYAGTNPLTLDALIARANEEFPYKGDLRIILPKDSIAAVAASKTHNGFIASAGTDRVFLDQYSGNILKKEPFSEKKLGAQIAALIYPLHVGDVFGTFSKIIYFIVCLIATSLPVTGTIIWINKLRKKAEKKKEGKGKKKSSKKTKVSKQEPAVAKTEV